MVNMNEYGVYSQAVNLLQVEQNQKSAHPQHMNLMVRIPFGEDGYSVYTTQLMGVVVGAIGVTYVLPFVRKKIADLQLPKKRLYIYIGCVSLFFVILMLTHRHFDQKTQQHCQELCKHSTDNVLYKLLDSENIKMRHSAVIELFERTFHRMEKSPLFMTDGNSEDGENSIDSFKEKFLNCNEATRQKIIHEFKEQEIAKKNRLLRNAQLQQQRQKKRNRQ